MLALGPAWRGLALWLADALLARALGWDRPVPLLAAHLPLARYREPDAGYLAWIDVSAYGWGDDPAPYLRRAAKVALHHGPEFGPQGAGYVRLNFGCGPDVLTEAITRIGAVAAEATSPQP